MCVRLITYSCIHIRSIELLRLTSQLSYISAGHAPKLVDFHQFHSFVGIQREWKETHAWVRCRQEKKQRQPSSEPTQRLMTPDAAESSGQRDPPPLRTLTGAVADHEAAHASQL